MQFLLFLLFGKMCSYHFPEEQQLATSRSTSYNFKEAKLELGSVEMHGIVALSQFNNNLQYNYSKKQRH